MKSSALSSLSVVAFVLTTSTHALAEDAQVGPHERSRAEYQAGNEAFRAGHFESARQHYQTALQIERSFDIVCNLGRTEAELGDDKLALTHLDECLKEYPPGDKVAAAREKFFELREKVRERCKAKRCDERVRAASRAAPAAKKEEDEPTIAPAVPEPLRLPEEGSARTPIVVTMAALGAVGIGAGVAFLVHSESEASEATRIRQEIVDDGGYCSGSPRAAACNDFADKRAAANDAALFATTGFIAGGVLLGAALVTYLVWPDEPAVGTAVGVRPEWALSADGSSGYLGVVGSF